MTKNLLRYFINIYKKDINNVFCMMFKNINGNSDPSQYQVIKTLMRHMFPYESKNNKKRPVQKCYATRQVKDIIHLFECIPEEQLLIFYRNLYQITELGLNTFELILKKVNVNGYNNIKSLLRCYKTKMININEEIVDAQDLLDDILNFSYTPKMRIISKDTINLQIGFYSKSFRSFHSNEGVSNCPFTSYEVLYSTIGSCKDYFIRTIPVVNTFLTKIIDKPSLFEFERLNDDVKKICNDLGENESLKSLYNKFS